MSQTYDLSVVEKNVPKEMTNVVFGSNTIERVGLERDGTVRICQKAFKGECAELNCSVDRTTSVNTTIERLIDRYGLHPCHEVIQHSKALQYFVKALALNNEPLSEGLIKNTHRILCTNVDAGRVAWINYAGKYHLAHFHAGNCRFVLPQVVPKKMAELVRAYNSNVANIEKAKSVDPVSLATKYCREFMMIQPFLDGNERLCRIILNAIMLKYSGVMVPFGETDEQRSEFLEVSHREGGLSEGYEGLATMVLRKAVVQLRKKKQLIVAWQSRRATYNLDAFILHS